MHTHTQIHRVYIHAWGLNPNVVILRQFMCWLKKQKYKKNKNGKLLLAVTERLAWGGHRLGWERGNVQTGRWKHICRISYGVANIKLTCSLLTVTATPLIYLFFLQSCYGTLPILPFLQQKQFIDLNHLMEKTPKCLSNILQTLKRFAHFEMESRLQTYHIL